MAKLIKCCICGKVMEEKYSYDAEPYKKGLCCAECNFKIVAPAKQNRRLKGK